VLIDLIAGARPNFMKVASIVQALEARRRLGGELQYRLVHTGQRYDQRMSGEFFRQLEIPEPEVNLEVGSGTQAEQTAGIMTRYERLLLDRPSECCVVGDSTERPETIEWGTNELLGTDPRAIAPAFKRPFEGKWKQGTVPELWDGRAGERIAVALEDLLSSGPAQLRQSRTPVNRERR